MPTYRWLATFRQDDKKGSVGFYVEATDLANALVEALNQRPSFHRPDELVEIKRMERLREN